MQLKPVIQALAAVWLVLFVMSFVAIAVADSDDDFASGLSRIVSFLTWQAIAFAVAAVGAFATRHAAARGVQGVKLPGYLPLAVSVFLVAAFIALVGYRVFVVPLFEVT